MIPGRIEGATRYLGAPVGWKPNESGPCAHLPILDQPIGGNIPAMHSVWEPTPDEVARLSAGALVYLCVVGRNHPPVSLLAGDARSPTADLVPAWEGQFDNFNQWVAWASYWLTGRTGSVGQPLPAICVDAKGRRCHVGKDFMRARDEDAFPVRFFWECKLP